MNQLTIRGFDKKFEHEIRNLAERENISLNKAVLRILDRGMRSTDTDSREIVIGPALDHLAGTWTEDEARMMDEVEKDFERIDSELWS